MTAWSNATNLTDGLDGLATGVSIFVFGAYTFIASLPAYSVLHAAWGQPGELLLDPRPA